MSKEVMDANEVAEYLGISPSTVYKKVEYRDIPFTQIKQNQPNIVDGSECRSRLADGRIRFSLIHEHFRELSLGQELLVIMRVLWGL